MKSKFTFMALMLLASLSAVRAATLCTGSSVATAIDLSSGPRTATPTETIRYSTAWATSAAGATAVVAVDGDPLAIEAGSGAVKWRPSLTGTYTLTHTVMDGDTQVGDTLTATFVFRASDWVATPVIAPTGGVVDEWPLSITMTCATEGATIHYTTDGTEPTAESPRYSRFRITERTTVKAVAVKDGLCGEVAVAEFAAGQCADPIIMPANGMSFEHAGQEVAIAWSGSDGVLRYTTDGSDPTAESPAYAGPFTINDTAVVKAKAFGDQFFDSAVVTAALTRVWVNVTTPVVTAASSFTGTETKVEISCATPGALIRYTLNGNDPNSHSTRYTGPFYVAQSCTVKAYAVCDDYLASAVASFAIEKVWGIGDTMGAPDHAFGTGGDAPFFRVTDATAPAGEAMQSGAITHEQESTMTTIVQGPGTVLFQWMTSCEEDDMGLYEWDHAEFNVDGAAVAKLDGETAWQTVSCRVEGPGAHTLVWRYVKDDIESVGEDCCRVAGYAWASDYTATQTTPVPVAYAWLRGYFPHTPDEYEAYEAAAYETAANGKAVWLCYVAGMDPTDEAAALRVGIEFEDGEAVVTFDPPRPAYTPAEWYHVLGKTNLTDEAWSERDAGHRFFIGRIVVPEE